MRTPNQTGPPAGLRRDLGLAGSVALGLGAVIGAGIFVVTGVAAGIAGPAFLIGLIVAGLAAVCNGLSSAELAALYPQSGGTYEYGYRVLYPYAGFAAGWMFLCSKLAAAGTVALGLGSALSMVFPSLPPRLTAVGAAIISAVANYYGIKKAGRVNAVIVTLTVGSLLYFVLGGLPSFQAANLRPFAPHGWKGIAEASGILFFAYTGYARLATLGEEVREPRRTIPRAIILTLVSSLLLYLAVGLVAVGVIGAPAMAATAAPLQRAAERSALPGMLTVVTMGGLTAMLGVLFSQILGISRMILAMARRRDLPPLLEVIHPRYAVPHFAIAATTLAVIILALAGNLHFIVESAAFMILVYYSITNLAALRLDRGEKLYPVWVAIGGLLGSVLMAFSLKPRAILIGAILLLAGFGLRAVCHLQPRQTS